MARRHLRRRPRSARRRNLWLFGAFAGLSYGDNSAALFEYVRSCHPEIDARWVISDRSIDQAGVREIGPVLDYDPVETYEAGMTADALIISHGVHDIPAFASRHSDAFRVRLGHGLSALKMTKAKHRSLARNPLHLFDLVPVASAFEAQVKAGWGIPTDRIAVTGICRFDTLLGRRRKRPTPASSRLLYMPTWRDDREQSAEIIQRIVALLTDESLQRALSVRGARLRLVLHPATPAGVRRELSTQVGRSTELTGDVASIQEHLAATDLLITDYSSVTWDALYADIPIIFYRFDEAEQETTRPSTLPKQWGLPGPIARTSREAANEVVRFLREGAPLDDDATDLWKARMFAFDDDRNCERVFEEICRRLPTHRNWN